jgi:hypothetical protein
VLRSACRRFRERFEPGRADPHRRRCPACDAYASAVEAAARAAELPLPPGLAERLRAVGRDEAPPLAIEVPDLPLPPRLAARLRTIAGDEAPPVPVDLPELPLPPALAARLRAIPRSAAPRWVRSPWRSLAASLLLALAIEGALGNPVALAQPVAEAVSERLTATVTGKVSAALEETARERQEVLQKWLEPAVETLGRRLQSAWAAAGGWWQRLDGETRELWDAVFGP